LPCVAPIEAFAQSRFPRGIAKERARRLTAHSRAHSVSRAAMPEAAAAQRDGVALTEDLIRRKAEHNEGMLSTLEEIALHQLDIDKIETINNCRYLKILYLQNNLISKIEGVNRLKRLEYLNLALNNIERIEGLERCESLNKLDLTVNFIDNDELHTVSSLKNNTLLRELYLTGNPLTQHWADGFRPYVIATLPQLEKLDGQEITRSERVRALQRFPELERELQTKAEEARLRKAGVRARQEAKRLMREQGTVDSDEDDTDEWCPEVRVRDAREVRETQEKQEEERQKSRRGGPGDLFGDQPERERRLLKDDGTPVQMNTAKWPFAIEDDGTEITLDVALPKFLDSAQIDADVQPTYICVKAKKNILQVVLPAEVLTDASRAERSATTGHLVLHCPKVHPIVVSRAPEPRRKPNARAALRETATAQIGHSKPGDSLKGAVDIRHIIPSAAGTADGAAPKKAQAPMGAEWDDEEDVPPLE